MNHPNHQDLLAADRAHIIHPYLPGTTEERVIMTSGSGCRLTDSEGRSYLDATGGLWLAQIGHGRTELADVAHEQMKKLEYFTSFWEFSNERAIELAARLASLAPRGPEPRLLHLRRLRGQRGRHQDGPLLPPPARREQPDLDPGAQQGLPRHRLRRRLGHRLPPCTTRASPPMMPHVSHLTPAVAVPQRPLRRPAADPPNRSPTSSSANWRSGSPRSARRTSPR